jgi:hypothetical protein
MRHDVDHSLMVREGGKLPKGRRLVYVQVK